MLFASQEPLSRLADTLLQRIAGGDKAAVGLVLDRYGGLVWSLARRAFPNASDAEEVVQEIFLEVWRMAGRFDPAIAAEATFIAMIARRRLIDRRRKVGRTIATTELAVEPGGASDRELNRADVGDDAKRAAEALATLSAEQQRVLRLSVIQGLSHEKIAAATGLPLGTVKTHVRRGLIRVRELLETKGTGTRSVGASS
jgi:RNA polymerase sigma factor (sigma-70 family)